MIRSILLIFLCIGLVQNACTVTQIKNLVNNSLVFAGNASASSSGTTNLHFLFYGMSGVSDRAQLKNHPTIIVLGSPGSSSHYLNFGGLGPMAITSNLTLTPNPNTANTYANLMFVDTLGVGFSYASLLTDIPTTLLTMSTQLTYALKEFKKNVDFATGKWIFVGEGSWIKSVSGIQDFDDNLIGVVSLSSWGDMYDFGKYAGVAGVEMGIISTSQKNTIESTFTTCYLYIKNGKYNEAHKCYDDTLNFVEAKTNNRNLYNINLNNTLIDLFAKVQAYLTQSTVAASLLAPSNNFFEAQSAYFQGKIFAELSQNNALNISNYMRDYLSVKFLFVSGVLDYISFSKAARNWLESLTFKDVAQFKAKTYDNITLDGNIIGVGKEITQVKYVELLKTGHYPFTDQPAIMNSLLKNWVQKLSSPQPQENTTTQILTEQ